MAGTPVFSSTGLLKTDLGSDWEFQSAEGPGQSAGHAEAVSGDGDVVGESAHSKFSQGSETYIYTGSATDYGTATTGALDANNALPGKYASTTEVLITAVEIDYGPCAQGQRERVKFSWTKGPAADCAVYKCSLTTALKTKQENEGVPALLTNSNADSKCQTVTYALTSEVGRDFDDAGEYLCGGNYKGQETLNATYVGIPSLTTTGWVVTVDPTGTGAGNKSNTSYDTYNMTAAKAVVRQA